MLRQLTLILALLLSSNLWAEVVKLQGPELYVGTKVVEVERAFKVKAKSEQEFKAILADYLDPKYVLRAMALAQKAVQEHLAAISPRIGVGLPLAMIVSDSKAPKPIWDRPETHPKQILRFSFPLFSEQESALTPYPLKGAKTTLYQVQNFKKGPDYFQDKKALQNLALKSFGLEIKDFEQPKIVLGEADLDQLLQTIQIRKSHKKDMQVIMQDMEEEFGGMPGLAGPEKEGPPTEFALQITLEVYLPSDYNQYSLRMNQGYVAVFPAETKKFDSSVPALQMPATGLLINWTQTLLPPKFHNQELGFTLGLTASNCFGKFEGPLN